jgi:hypothetical protein
MGMNIRPLPGYAFIVFESYFDRATGMIVVPKVSEKRRRMVGRIVRASASEYQKARIPELANLDGRRVVVKPYIGTFPVARVGDKIPVAAIEAILDDDSVVAQPSDGAVERCKWCGPAVQGGETDNAMILMDGVCPRCLRDRNGIQRFIRNERGGVDEPVTVSSGEVERFKEMQERAMRGE